MVARLRRFKQKKVEPLQAWLEGDHNALLMEELNRRGMTGLAMALGTGAIVRAGGGFTQAAADETESDKRRQPSKEAAKDHNNDNGGAVRSIAPRRWAE